MNFSNFFGSIFLLALITGCHHKTAQNDSVSMKINGGEITFAADSPQLASLSIEAAQSQQVAVTHISGRLYWNDDATVRIFSPLVGRVDSILAKLGETISGNAPLARIHSPDYDQAVADSRTAEGNLRLAESALNRTRELLEHGAAPRKDLDNAEAAYTSATSERDRSRARLALYEGPEKGTNGFYLLRSPLAGVVVEKNINPGQEIRPDQMLANAAQLFAPLFVVSDPTKLWIQLDVSEVDIAFLRLGQRLRIASRAYPERTFEGRLENIGDSLDPSTRTIKARGVVDNPGRELKAEMYVTVDVLTDSSKTASAAVEVPAKAVFVKDNKSYLFIEQSPGRFERQLVKTARESDGKTLVTEGLRSGQRVVTDGCLLLQALTESTDKS